MKRKGDMLFWEISDVATTKEELIKLGFDRFVPRNDYRSALIKAIKKVTKGDDKLYRRFGEGSGECKFGIFAETVSGDELNISREIGIILNKTTGELRPIRPEDVESRMYQTIAEEYKEASKTLDSNQFRALVLKVVKSEGYAVAMRKGGGIYFVDERFDGTVSRLEQLFGAFEGKARLSRVPIFDNAGTDEALSHAISEDISDDISTLIAEVEERYKNGTITHRQLEGDMNRADEIVKKYKIHSENLRARSVSINVKIQKVVETLKSCKDRVEQGIVSTEDFATALELL